MSKYRKVTREEYTMIDILHLVKAGKLVEAEAKVVEALNEQRDQLLEVGRQNLADSILPSGE